MTYDRADRSMIGIAVQIIFPVKMYTYNVICTAFLNNPHFYNKNKDLQIIVILFDLYGRSPASMEKPLGTCWVYQNLTKETLLSQKNKSPTHADPLAGLSAYKAQIICASESATSAKCTSGSKAAA